MPADNFTLDMRCGACAKGDASHRDRVAAERIADKAGAFRRQGEKRGS
jgi:hypothetical protein